MLLAACAGPRTVDLSAGHVLNPGDIPAEAAPAAEPVPEPAPQPEPEPVPVKTYSVVVKDVRYSSSSHLELRQAK